MCGSLIPLKMTRMSVQQSTHKTGHGHMGINTAKNLGTGSVSINNLRIIIIFTMALRPNLRPAY
jgi:hypothetical protein